MLGIYHALTYLPKFRFLGSKFTAYVGGFLFGLLLEFDPASVRSILCALATLAITKKTKPLLRAASAAMALLSSLFEDGGILDKRYV